MMSHEKFDYIVIGAGIVGTCTAWRLSQKAAGKILLLEQVRLSLIFKLSSFQVCNLLTKNASKMHLVMKGNF